MLANNKTSEQITEELVDLIGDNYGSSELTSVTAPRCVHSELTLRSHPCSILTSEPSFTTWLFARASGEVPQEVKPEPVAEQQVEAAAPEGRA